MRESKKNNWKKNQRHKQNYAFHILSCIINYRNKNRYDSLTHHKSRIDLPSVKGERKKRRRARSATTVLNGKLEKV